MRTACVKFRVCGTIEEHDGKSHVALISDAKAWDAKKNYMAYNKKHVPCDLCYVCRNTAFIVNLSEPQYEMSDR